MLSPGRYNNSDVLERILGLFDEPYNAWSQLPSMPQTRPGLVAKAALSIF